MKRFISTLGRLLTDNADHPGSVPDPPKFEGGQVPNYPGQVPDHPSFKGGQVPDHPGQVPDNPE